MFSVKRLYLETKLKKNFHYFRHYSHFFEKKVVITQIGCVDRCLFCIVFPKHNDILERHDPKYNDIFGLKRIKYM